MSAEVNVNIYNDFQREDQQLELRCQGCLKFLDARDLSCGLSLYCIDCCDEPDWAHSPASKNADV